MTSLVECVPNFSEGRKADVIERLAKAIESVAGAVVLDTHMDADHNRSVITFVTDRYAFYGKVVAAEQAHAADRE